MQQQYTKETIKYRLTAHILSLHINKNLNFQTKVIWKRNLNKSQTQTADHQQGISVFNQTLALDLNLVYNHQRNKFQDKYTEFSVIVIYQAKKKSGGYVKYDASEIVNKNYNNELVRLNLTECPDPNAYIEIVFNYQTTGQSSRTLFNQLSLLNPSGFENDLSQIDFHDDENHEQNTSTSQKDTYLSLKHTKNNTQQLQMTKINNIITKMEILAQKSKCSQKASYQQDHNSTKSQNLQFCNLTAQNEQKLKLQIRKLEQEIQLRDQRIKQSERKVEQHAVYIRQLQIKLEMSQLKIQHLQDQYNTNNQIQVALMQRHIQLKALYEKAQKELELFKNSPGDMNFSKQSMGFNKFLEEVNEIQEVPQFDNDKSTNHNQQKIQQLERQTVELQSKIAAMSHSIAQLFNAAYEFGGPSLLDYLQNSIGLVQQDL